MSTSLINKIELLIKREKTTPERKKDEPPKSSSEILSELFSAFNADPPKIDDISVKKSKKSKKKHKKEKKKRSRSSSNSSSEDDSDYSHRRKKRKKSKSKKRRSRTPSRRRTRSPKHKPPEPETVRVKEKTAVKTEDIKVKKEEKKVIKKEEKENVQKKVEKEIKTEPKPEPKRRVSIKSEGKSEIEPSQSIDLIPMPESPKESKLDSSDLRHNLDTKKCDSETDKAKGKIQIKNLKFSTVFEETVKKAEEEARKKAEKYEEGEYTDSSNESVKEVVTNSQFPKTSDPGGLKKAAEDKVVEEDKSHRKSKKETSHKSSKRERDRSKTKRSSSKSRRSRSRSPRKHRARSPSKGRRSRSRHRSGSRGRRRSASKTRRRSRSRSRMYSRHHSPRHRRDRDRDRGRSRSPSGVKLADSEKKRLLEVARRNAINMLKNGAVPAGAAALPPHTRNQVMAAIQSGGKSVDELTDFCKHLSKKEALGELSSVSSHDDDMSENEDTLAFHHPFLVKEKGPIIMNIRGGAPLPIKTNNLPVANKEELRLQFPVSSGSQHREKATEWRPVSPKKDNMQVAKLNSKHLSSIPIPTTPAPTTAPAPKAIESATTTSTAPLALPAPPPAPVVPIPPPNATPNYLKAFSTASQLTTVPLALPAPGPQAYPPGVDPPKIDLAKIVSEKLLMIRKEQEQNELTSVKGFGWTKESASLGQFTGTTGAQILTPRELASGTQAWAKKDQLQRAAPVEGGMGMHLLQKMGWTPGRGLGKEGTGTLQPLLLEVKLDTKGLQAKEEVSSRNNRGMKPQRGRGMGRGGGGGGGAGGGVTLLAGGKHPVSLLGEYCSKQKLGPPEYNLCFECGPDHKKNFLFKVKVAGTEYQPAVASQNKKQAKADAAQLALQKLSILP